MPRRMHHIHGTLNHRNTQSTDKAGTSTYRAHMDDKMHENDGVEGSGAQRHGSHTVGSERTVKSSAGHARRRNLVGRIRHQGPAGEATWPPEGVESGRRQLSGFLTPRSLNKLKREGLFLPSSLATSPEFRRGPRFLHRRSAVNPHHNDVWDWTSDAHRRLHRNRIRIGPCASGEIDWL